MFKLKTKLAVNAPFRLGFCPARRTGLCAIGEPHDDDVDCGEAYQCDVCP